MFERVPRARIYDVTGTQFLTFNTLYQLFAACRATPRLIEAASQFGTIPDILQLLADRRAARRVQQRDNDADG